MKKAITAIALVTLSSSALGQGQDRSRDLSGHFEAMNRAMNDSSYTYTPPPRQRYVPPVNNGPTEVRMKRIDQEAFYSRIRVQDDRGNEYDLDVRPRMDTGKYWLNPLGFTTEYRATDRRTGKEIKLIVE